tara:strand:+ start:13569 stop:15002 length:1434 start_codon:yes stop_codon:yes gene_type:complete
MKNQVLKINKSQIQEEFNNLLNYISEKDYNAYLVGGAVRDLVLGDTPNDFDFVVDKNIDQFTKSIATYLKCKRIKFSNHGLSTYRLVNMDAKIFIDVTEFESQDDGLINDLSKRDFTINSMAIKITKDKDFLNTIIDPFNGISDLKNKILRYTDRNKVLDDPLRLLRLVRLSSKLDLQIDPKTLNYFKKQSYLINEVSKERVRDELIEIFTLKKTYESVLLLKDTNLLTFVFPFIAGTLGVEQLGFHDKDVFNHQVAALYYVEKLIDDEVFGKLDKNSYSHDKNIIPYIKLATFFHDIGKPITKKIVDDKITFISHEELGSRMASEYLTGMKFSLKSKNYINNLIRNHLRLGHLISLATEPSDKSLRKLERDCGEFLLELVYLDFADFLSTSVYNSENYIDHFNKLSKIYFRIKNISTDLEQKYANVIDGHQIMEIFGLNEGPEVGRVLNAIENELINSGNMTKAKALKLAENLLKK